MSAPMGREQSMSRTAAGDTIWHVWDLDDGRALRMGTEFTDTNRQRWSFVYGCNRGLACRPTPTKKGYPDPMQLVDPATIKTIHRKKLKR